MIFSENENGGFDSYLVEYPFSEKEMLLNSGENLETLGAEFTVLNKVTEYICIEYVVYSGCSATHSNGYTCSGTESTYDCYNTSGGSSSSTGGSTAGTGTGATTGGSGGVLTSPTPGGAGSGIANTPCNKIKGATSNNSAYMNNFKNINKPKVLNQPMESGFSQVGNQYVFGKAI